MAATAAQLRVLAADCRAGARTASPNRARQLRACARTFVRMALQAALFEHSKQVGRANVTQTSYRAHLRATRS